MHVNETEIHDLYGMSILITGGAGVLGGAMVKGLIEHGANVSILDYNLDAASNLAELMEQKPGFGNAIAVQGNVLETESLVAAVETTISEFGKIDGLINAAGGNKAEATTSTEKTFFDLSHEALRGVFD